MQQINNNITNKNNVKKYTELYDIKILNNNFNSITEIQWYEYLFRTPNGSKLNVMPLYIYKDINKISNICRYAISNKLKCKTRDDILLISHNDIKKLKINFRNPNTNQRFTVYEIITLAFPEFNIKSMELHNAPNGFLGCISNRIKKLELIFDKYNIEFNDIINNKINKQWFKDKGCASLLDDTTIYDLLIQYCKYKYNEDICYGDFRIKPNGFYKLKDNGDYVLKKIINLLIKNKVFTVENAKIIIPNIFSYKNLQNSKMSELLIANHKYFNTYCFYNWINELFPEFDLTIEDFNYHIGIDNITKLGSLEEKLVFDYIYKNLSLNIKAIGSKSKINRKYKFIQLDSSIDSYYQPDFVIEQTKDNYLDKPLIIEYYGMFKETPNNDIYFEYKNKTCRKNEFYKNNPDIYFIDLYPEDLKNNFEGVRNKLTSFFVKNLNINLEDLSS